MSSFYPPTASLGDNKGQTKRIGLFEWLESQLPMHERDTEFHGNSERRFPVVISALIDLQRKLKLFCRIWAKLFFTSLPL